MEDPEWAQVLTAIYREGETVDLPSDLENLSDDHLLIKRTDVPPDKVKESIRFLENQELIAIEISSIEVAAENEEDRSEYRDRAVKLKPRGFDVAHDRELRTQSNAGNYAVAALTAVLGLTALVQAAIAYATDDLGPLPSVVIGVLLITTTIVFSIVWFQLQRAGALDIQTLVDRRERHQ